MSHPTMPGTSNPAVHTVLVSPQLPSVLRDLRSLGLQPLPMEPYAALPGPVRCHADLVCFPLDAGTVLLAPGSARLDAAVAALGLRILRPSAPLGDSYPRDTPLCAARVGEYLLCRSASTDPAVLAWAEHGHILNVRQGYARCSTFPVDAHSLITADPSIACAAEGAGLDVLRIQPGFIRLDGYDTGFIGGCVIRIAGDAAYLTGKLVHPDRDRIRQFAAARGVVLIEGSAPELWDIGAGVGFCANIGQSVR